MQKKILEIQDKYSNDQARQSQELMDLYKREHYSPFSGCLTSIVQMFLVLAMFYLVSQPLTYMKQVETDKIDNYVTQITNEGKNVRYREIAVIKEMREKDESVRINMDFLGLDLSDIPSENYTNWKVYIIPILYVFTSFVSTKIITLLTKDPKEIAKKKEEKALIKQEEKKENKEAEAMTEMNKQMQLMVPIMSVSIALIAPLGLALYWLVGNLFSLCERLILNKFFKKGEEDNG